MTKPLTSHLLAQEARASRHFWYRLRARAIDRFIAPNSTVLDVGAGAGSLGHILRESRPDVVYRFREPEPELHEHLVATFGGTSQAPAGTKFDGATCAVLLDVIEHVEDDAELLRAIARELPTGSTIAVTVPAFKILWSGWDTTVGHFRRYNRRELRRTLVDAGLTVTDTRYIFLELFPVAVARRVLRRDTGEDFPPIGAVLNRTLWTIGVITQTLGRLNPIGTSIVAAATVNAPHDDR
ncbi:MAG: methyltransferase domain-containing protein [Actinobacteria bacterium]|nr:methyltransferase domain-containing protein [Actinomycetota bacterium]